MPIVPPNFPARRPTFVEGLRLIRRHGWRHLPPNCACPKCGYLIHSEQQTPKCSECGYTLTSGVIDLTDRDGPRFTVKVLLIFFLISLAGHFGIAHLVSKVIIPHRNLEMNWNWEYLARDYQKVILHAEGSRSGLGFYPWVVIPPSELYIGTTNSGRGGNFRSGIFVIKVAAGNTEFQTDDLLNPRVVPGVPAPAVLEEWLRAMSDRPRPTAHEDAIELRAMIDVALQGKPPPIPYRHEAWQWAAPSYEVDKPLSRILFYTVWFAPFFVLVLIFWHVSRY